MYFGDWDSTLQALQDFFPSEICIPTSCQRLKLGLLLSLFSAIGDEHDFGIQADSVSVASTVNPTNTRREINLLLISEDDPVVFRLVNHLYKVFQIISGNSCL